jgi:hypothetical protein
MTAPPRERTRPGEADRRVRKGGDAVRQPVVDDGCRERGGIVQRSRRTRPDRPARQVGGDDGPRGVGVAASEIEAAEAGTEPGFHERADAGAAVVDDDREVRHIAAEPWEMTRGRDDPGRCDHGERHAVDGRVGGDRGLVAEHREVRRKLLGDEGVGIERHERACTARIGR